MDRKRLVYFVAGKNPIWTGWSTSFGVLKDLLETRGSADLWTQSQDPDRVRDLKRKKSRVQRKRELFEKKNE